MGHIGISITKRTIFRDSTQEFSNVYHYGSAYPNPSAGYAETLLNELVAIEKTLHSTAVTFVHGRVWSAGGTRQQNQMIFEKPLTGTGTTGTSAGVDRERAYLIQWNAGVDSRGKPVKLKKWFHSCGFIGSHALTSNILDNTAGFSNTERQAIANKVDAVTRLGTGIEEWGMIAPSGRQRDGGPPVAHKYLEHRQLGDQWRG